MAAAQELDLPKIITLIAQSLQHEEHQIRNVIKLFDEGATIPFVSRYRKEMTGGKDEVQLAEIKEKYEKLTEIAKRKTAVRKSIEEQGKLTPELNNRITACWDATELEDLYLPYKPKRRTRADSAKEKGLEPLAKMIMKQNVVDVETLAKPYVKGEVADVAVAISGAKDIIAEWISESESARNIVRNVFQKSAIISSKLIK